CSLKTQAWRGLRDVKKYDGTGIVPKIRFRFGLNTYSYVHDPLGWMDPLGLDGCPGTEGPKAQDPKKDHT
ncbi:hypothetical protein, partial [Salmonella enterica]|uniref:hypothetical protein n=1 Tax=Salmonella enterica TaxID=28901 RepID=UPI001C393C0A